MKSIFEKPHLKKDVNRSAFDISQKRVEHIPFGMLLPCFYKRVPANSFVEIEPESQFICDSIQRPAFIRLKENIDFYAVPVSQLWKPFDNLITGQDNMSSSAVSYFNSQSGSVNDSQIPTQVPVFDSAYLERTLESLATLRDVHGYSHLLSTLRLLDRLGYGNYYFLAMERWFNNDMSNPNVDVSANIDGTLTGYEPTNFFGLLAYQKVYYDYYRNPKYEKCLTSAYNIDNMRGGLQSANTVSTDSLEIFKVHYAWSKKDYFTNVQPSILPTSNDIGYSGLQNNAPNSGPWQLFGVPGASQNGSISAVFNNSVSNQPQQNHGFAVANMYPATSAPAGITGATNITALRFAFAYDKLLRRMREAGGTFDKQMLAQFGITPYDARNGKCRYIGGQTNRLNASDVTNVSGDGLGQLGSQINVYSAPRGKFKYETKEDTIIIGMYSTSLDFDYPSTQIIRENLARYRFDWFNPAFQNLGLQPLYKIEFNNMLYHNGSLNTDYVDNSDDRLALLGFTKRYSDYKTNIDKVYGLYAYDSEFVGWRAWTAPYTDYVFDGATHQFDNPHPLTRKQLQFNPAQFNRLVANDYNGFWQTDPFTTHLYVHCKLIANMSVDGEEF